MPINCHLKTENFKESFKSEVKLIFSKVGSAVIRQLKLKLYQDGVYPRPAWMLALIPIAKSWMEIEIERMVNFYLKKWIHLHRSALPALDVSKGGLGVPHISTRSLAQQASKCARFLTSKDKLCEISGNNSFISST